MRRLRSGPIAERFWAHQTYKSMPTRASHLPSHIERRALQELRAKGELSARKLEPTGLKTLQKMIAKGWLERGDTVGMYRITVAGETALRPQLPIERSR
jgi:hypothetical protein